ncbi:hypothetical protein ACFX13_029215 [Malus domestica]
MPTTKNTTAARRGDEAEEYDGLGSVIGVDLPEGLKSKSEVRRPSKSFMAIGISGPPSLSFLILVLLVFGCIKTNGRISEFSQRVDVELYEKLKNVILLQKRTGNRVD